MKNRDNEAYKFSGGEEFKVLNRLLKPDEKMKLVCRPSFFDYVVYDFDIPLPKEQCVKLREEEPKRFKALLEKTMSEALRLYWHLHKSFLCSPMLVYTGNRRYQVWLHLEKPLPAAYHNMILHYYILGLEFGRKLDPNVAEPARMARLPYTKHEQVGLAVPLDPKTLEPFKLEEVASRLKATATRTLEELIGIEPVKIPKPVSIGKKRTNKKFRIRPCIQEVLNRPLDGGDRHMMRIAVATEHLHAGYRIDEVVDLFKNQPDFNSKITRYYVEHLAKRGFKPFRCETIRKLGFCLDYRCSVKEGGLKS